MNKIEEARELCNKFRKFVDFTDEDCNTCYDATLKNCKECALVVIREELTSIMLLNILCTFENPMKEHFNKKIEELKSLEQEVINLK